MPLIRPSRALLAVCTLLVLSGLWVCLHSTPQRDHYMTPELSKHYADLVGRDHQSDLTSTRQLPPSDVVEICAAVQMRHFGRQRKVYDLVMFSTELDWLEIRLHEHGPYVDYFVVIESPTTFSGIAKPLILKDNWDRFKEFHHKIIYRIVEDPVKSTRSWDHEDYLRNAMLREVFPTLAKTNQQAAYDDVLIVSDMDELLRSGTLLVLRHCEFPARLTLRSQFYYYSFQWRHRGEQWAHPEATTFRNSVEDTIVPNDLRMNLLGPGWAPFAALRRWRDHATLWDAGWHCSSCFRTINEMQVKMQSFSHQGWNTAENRNAKAMVDRVRQGLDLFGREGEFYDKIEANEDVPQYVKHEYKSHDRFEYLLNRDKANAGFEDWETAT